MTAERLGWLAALACLVGCVVVIVALVGVRVAKDRAERRRARLRGPVWVQIMTLTTGEDDEVDEAADVLRRTTPAAREAVVEDAFALVPKLRGTARERLREVLRDWGLREASLRLAQSGSTVRKCRGMHRLGVLADASSTETLLAGLRDRTFAVRRTSLLALGSFPHPEVVEAALDAAAQEPRLRRTFLATMDRIGQAAVPVLRSRLEAGLAEPDEEGERRGHLAAEALGLVGAVSAAPTLERALDRAGDELTMACLNSLGILGAPSSVPVIVAALGHQSTDVRRTAAAALGRIGAPAAIPELARSLGEPHVEVARAAAQALERCGPRGMEVLRGSPAPVARETVALAELTR